MKEPGFEFNIMEEGLIGFVPFASNRIVIVGTAERGPIAISSGRAQLTAKDLTPYADYASLERDYGTYDEFTGQTELTIMRGTDLLTRAGANYIYPIRICNGTESGGTLRVRTNTNTVGAYAMEIGSYDTGSYSSNISVRIRDSDASPVGIEEIFYPDGTTTGFTLRFYPTTGNVQRIPPGGTLALLTGSTWTTVEVANLVDPLDGQTPVKEGTNADWANGTVYTVNYGNNMAGYGWTHIVLPTWTANFGTGATNDVTILCDTGAPNGNNLLFADDATNTSASTSPCTKGKAIRVRYFYDTKDFEVKWKDRTELFSNLNNVNHWITQVNSGSTLIKLYSDTGTAQQVVVQDSGTSTMPLNMGWTNLNKGDDGRGVTLGDYRAAWDLIAETNWDYIVFPGVFDRRIFGLAESRLNTDETQNFEHKAVFGHDTGQTIGEVIGLASQFRNKRIDWITFGEHGVQMTNRYTDKIETGAASYGACLYAGNASKRTISTDMAGEDLDGCEGLFGEWSKPERERLLDFGIKSVKSDADGYRINRDITSSVSSAWLKSTTVKIIDYARRGVRSVLRPFLHKKNISRIRKLMEIKADDFYQDMLNNEHIIGYEPTKVTATRAEQISGITQVNTSVKPVFHVEYIKYNMNLE